MTILADRLKANIARAQALTDAAGVGNRPHIKTHKIPAVGRMQMAAGAIGITCQKLGEVDVFTDAGVADDILLTFNIVGEAKTDRLMELSEPGEAARRGRRQRRRGPRACRRPASATAATCRCSSNATPAWARNGVQTPEAARELARFAMNLPRIRFEGLMTFPNRAPGTVDFMNRALELFAADGIPIPVVSGGGSPALLTLGRFSDGHRAPRRHLRLQRRA